MRIRGILRDAQGVARAVVHGRNTVTTQGLQLLAETMLVSPPLSFGHIVMPNQRCGLIDGAGFTSVAVGDTMASHANWTEFSGYSGSRKTVFGSSPSPLKTQSLQVFTFTFTGAGSVQGAFIGRGILNTIGSTTGTLWATVIFDAAPLVVAAAETLDLFYDATEGTHDAA